MAGLAESLNDFTEIKIKGKTYKAGILTLGDWAEFEAFAHKLHRAKIIDTAREIYGENIPDSVLDKATKPLTDAETEEYQGSIIGVSFLLWKALSRFNPNMTQDEISDMITLKDLPNITEVITGGGDEKKTESTPLKIVE